MAPAVQVVVLAAGFGSRLGMPFPKPLTPLVSGRTIMARQLDGVRAVFGADVPVIVVVGFKLDLIMEAHPDVLYAYNERYDQTNTAKSLLRALRLAGPGGVLWLNGDVVFDPAILQAVAPQIAAGESFVCVNTAAVGEEEIKYTVAEDGSVLELSKQVRDGLGESVGINLIAGRDKAGLIKRLDECDEHDYFERAMELAIEHDGLRLTPVDISDLFAVEVDFAEDLERAIAARQEHARRTDG
jgi:choline kinase